MTRKYIFEIEITDEEKLITCEAIFNKMFKNTFFSICDVDRVINILNIEFFMESNLYEGFLYPLHCKYFKDMDDSTIEKLKEICYKLIDKHELPEVEYFEDEHLFI